jgi:hypothetical protein
MNDPSRRQPPRLLFAVEGLGVALFGAQLPLLSLSLLAGAGALVLGLGLFLLGRWGLHRWTRRHPRSAAPTAVVPAEAIATPAAAVPISAVKAANAAAADSPPKSSSGSEEAVRELAYSKWERAGKPEGDDLRFWLAAENELKADTEQPGSRRNMEGDDLCGDAAK